MLAVAGVVANDSVAGAACAVEPEKTVWPEDDVTLLAALLVLAAESPLPLEAVRFEPEDGFERSAEAGASLFATRGAVKPGAFSVAAGAAAAGVLG